MKKILSLIIILVTLVIIISSCSSTTSENAEEISDQDVDLEIVEEGLEEENAEMVEENNEEEINEAQIDNEEATAPEDEAEVENKPNEETIQQNEVATSNSEDKHVVEFTNDGFEPSELTIAVGDTVEWVNSRSGQYDKAMLLGTRSYTNIKSTMLEIDESFSWTFDEAGDYIFVDAILTTYVNKITVE